MTARGPRNFAQDTPSSSRSSLMASGLSTVQPGPGGTGSVQEQAHRHQSRERKVSQRKLCAPGVPPNRAFAIQQKEQGGRPTGRRHVHFGPFKTQAG